MSTAKLPSSSKQKALAIFFMRIASEERRIELKRQFLADQQDFEPYLAFRRILRSKPNGIDPLGLDSFFSENMMNCSQAKASDLIQHYDYDEDELLSYKEFMDIVLPREHPDLRAFVTQKDCEDFNINGQEILSKETENALADVLISEIQLMERLAGAFAELQSIGIQTAPGLIKLVDKQDLRAINYENLKDFLLDSGLLPYNAEIISVLRRIDKDGDGVISIHELDDFLTRFNKYDEEIDKADRHLKRMSASKTKTKNGVESDLEFSIRKSPLKSSLTDITNQTNRSLAYYRRSGSKNKSITWKTPEKPPIYTPTKSRRVERQVETQSHKRSPSRESYTLKKVEIDEPIFKEPYVKFSKTTTIVENMDSHQL